MAGIWDNSWHRCGIKEITSSVTSCKLIVPAVDDGRRSDMGDQFTGVRFNEQGGGVRPQLPQALRPKRRQLKKKIRNRIKHIERKIGELG